MEQIGARVAHVGDGERVVFDVGAGGCAAHAGLAQAVQGRLDYGGVGCLDGSARRAASADCGAVLAIVSTAMEEATSPAA